MNFKRIDSRCYAAVITEDGQWQKGEEYSSEDYTETLIFNEQGKLVEAYYGEEYHFLFTYDAYGNCVNSRLYDPEDEELTDCWEEKQYHYNDLQQKVECITYENGKWKETVTFEYDAHGNNISQLTRTADYQYLFQLEYDAKGRCIDNHYTNITTGEKIFHHSTEFHSDTEKVNTSFSESGKPFMFTITRFDEKGNVIYVAHQDIGDPEPYSITETTFDEHNNEIFERISNKEGEVYTRKYTYRYDNHGNWIEKRIEYSKRYTNLIVERTIEYTNE